MARASAQLLRDRLTLESSLASCAKRQDRTGKQRRTRTSHLPEKQPWEDKRYCRRPGRPNERENFTVGESMQKLG